MNIKDLSENQLQALGLPSATTLLQRADGAVTKANIAKGGLVVMITTPSIAERNGDFQCSHKRVGGGKKLSAATRAHFRRS